MKDFTIVFIHGYIASHLADWYPNISKELDQLNIEYAIPDCQAMNILMLKSG